MRVAAEGEGFERQRLTRPLGGFAGSGQFLVLADRIEAAAQSYLGIGANSGKEERHDRSRALKSVQVRANPWLVLVANSVQECPQLTRT